MANPIYSHSTDPTLTAQTQRVLNRAGLTRRRSPLPVLLGGLAIAISSAVAGTQAAIAQTTTTGVTTPTLAPPTLTVPVLTPPVNLIPAAVNPAPAFVGNTYALDGGDTIRIDIFDVPEFSGANGQYTILADGSLNLPWIGKVSVRGLNLEQAAQALASQYSRYINDPLITVTLLAPRPLRIGIIGQVNRPGVYTVSPATGNTPQKQTVTLALQSAGGITQIADVRNIQVRRPDPGGMEQTIPVNIWSFLQTGDLTQDIELRDGDTVVVPQAIAFNPAEASQLAMSNLSPSTINVNVVGEVMRPGALALPPNVSLNQAILASGGFNSQRARSSRVTLIRLNPDGTVTNRTVAIDFTDGLNEETNPPLHSSDIVIVGRSSLASASDFLGTLLSPLNGVFSIFSGLSGLGLTGGSNP